MNANDNTVNKRCPQCNADFDGGPIPGEIRQYYSPPYRWSRRISIVDQGLDRTVAFQCHECSHQWPATGD